LWRLLGGTAACTFMAPCLGGAAAGLLPQLASADAISPEMGLALYNEAMRSVAPVGGFTSRIALQDSVPNLVAHGVIDPQKLKEASARRAPVAAPIDSAMDWTHSPEVSPHRNTAVIEAQLRWPSLEPIHLTADNAGSYLNLLWPLGLANYMVANEVSPIVGHYLDRYASTAGWTLGRERNGAAYFNTLPVVPLTPEQEATVTRIAQSIFRPCCNNSAFFQDCNHGSAMLGLLQLGAAQGLMEDQLYREALAFNAMWFLPSYLQTALYFNIIERVEWVDVDPRTVLSYRYSAISPWRATVKMALAQIPGLPSSQSRATCTI